MTLRTLLKFLMLLYMLSSNALKIWHTARVLSLREHWTWRLPAGRCIQEIISLMVCCNQLVFLYSCNNSQRRSQDVANVCEYAFGRLSYNECVPAVVAPTTTVVISWFFCMAATILREGTRMWQMSVNMLLEGCHMIINDSLLSLLLLTHYQYPSPHNRTPTHCLGYCTYRIHWTVHTLQWCS